MRFARALQVVISGVLLSFAVMSLSAQDGASGQRADSGQSARCANSGTKLAEASER
jgi:hypothetical protein